MHTTVNWTSPICWLIVLALLVLLLVQVWLIVRNTSLSTVRKWIRGSLNGALWLLLVGYFLNIQWSIDRASTHALLMGDEVPAAFARQITDSLHIPKSFTSRNFKPKYDSVTLVGQQFPVELLTQLSGTNLRWVPYNAPDELQAIHWKGMVRQGEIQRVTGLLASSKEQWLRLRFGSKTLDSLLLHEGPNPFTFQFPAFGNGHSQIELVLGGTARSTTTLDTLRFYTRPTEPLKVQFLLNSPDFESKTLADWLGKHGHTVSVSATLSKNIGSNLTINQSGKSTVKTTPDLIITEPTNAANPTLRKAVADGKAVLFINLTNPETDSRAINQALGGRWQVRKFSNEPQVPVGNGLTALPYRFADQPTQFAVSGYPVAVQRTIGRVGVSLLSETYPLSLSGDSVAYSRIWTAILARLSATNQNTVQVDAPIYSHIRQAISVNNPTNRLSTLRVGQDTLRLVDSPLNERSATGQSSFNQAGWQSVQDSLALYVNGPTSTQTRDQLRDRQVVRQFMLAHEQAQLAHSTIEQTQTASLPNSTWLILLLICFTALWIEPKVR
ncbi:hypothetical protein [Spirosoma gilvum]